MKPVSVLFVGLLSLVCNGIYATIKLGVSGSRAFPAHLGAAVFDVERSTSFIALSQAVGGDDGQYAVSMVNAFQNQYQGVTPSKIRIGSVYDQDNPLFGKKILLLTLTDHAPMVVADDAPNKVFVIRNAGTFSSFLLSSPVLKLDDGIDCTRIEGLNGFLSQGAFFAVLRGVQPFGADDSTITFGAVQLDETQKTIVISQGETALVNKAAEFLKITNDLASIEPHVAMGVSEHLQAHYTGLRVVAGGAAGSGARAVFMGLDIPIAPDAAVEADSIIGTNVLGTAVRMYHVATMWATTGLDYLIVVGGVEPNPGDKARSVSALPLVGYGEGFGRLAKKDSEITTLVNAYSKKQVVGRAFSQAAAAAGEIPAPVDAASLVGGNGVLPGDVVQLLVSKDTVFVAVANDDLVHGGMFASTALFDGDGRIVGWTDWAPAGGVAENAVSSFLDRANGLWYSMRGATWADVLEVERTQWQVSTWGSALNEIFGQDEHGVQSVVDFPSKHPAFSQDGDNRTSLVCLTGNGKVALAQSGYTDATDCFRAKSSIATIQKNSTAQPADAYVWDEGAVAELGAIITADIVSHGGNSWLVVGGRNGAAVLCRPDGSGWVTGALGKNFAGLPTDLAWKKFYFGDAVRKICADGDVFFVLSESALYRYTPSPELFLDGGPGLLLATSDSFAPQYDDVRFSDFFATKQLALLATDAGLWRSGNAKDIKTVANQQTVAWTKVNLPESMYCVTRLYPISPTGINSDILSNDRGGNLLVLSSSVGRHGTEVYRFALRPVLGAGLVTNDTIAPLPDCFTVAWTRDEITEDPYKTYFVSRGDYRNYVATDGALWLFSRNAYAPSRAPAFVEVLPQAYRTMSTLGPSTSHAVWAAHNGSGMGPLCLRSSDGSWLVGGSYIYGQN